ncbi:MAG: ribosomal RNA small subunit methyltransferase A [Clostridiales bacterium]|nr:ribosomal RNA small subunit methyltransferase A [Clostridiales bacterium]
MIRDDLIKLNEQTGFSPELKFGQNFLSDENIISDIVDLCDIKKSDKVLEIGPGLGSLSLPLSGLTDNLTLVEIDKRLASFLGEKEGLNAKIIVSDFLKLKDYGAPGFDKIVSNLPYYVMTDIMKKLFAECVNAGKMVFMIEEDAFNRVVAKPGTKQYGPLSVLCSLYGNVVKEFTVQRSAFIPAPNTTSCVISLTKGERTLDQGLVNFLDQVFRMRRKKLLNNVKGIEDQLDLLNIDHNCRAEQLEPEALWSLYNAIIESGNKQA